MIIDEERVGIIFLTEKLEGGCRGIYRITNIYSPSLLLLFNTVFNIPLHFSPVHSIPRVILIARKYEY